ncbi:hypothetical protein GCM10009777_14790 [Microbacterium pumilum]|uniref:Uncharacterized protein n=1 Tax=Microbacterium pumilum TaxID=344165 RepID=A0ABN2S8E5_9MICO
MRRFAARSMRRIHRGIVRARRRVEAECRGVVRRMLPRLAAHPVAAGALLDARRSGYVRIAVEELPEQ